MNMFFWKWLIFYEYEKSWEFPICIFRSDENLRRVEYLIPRILECWHIALPRAYVNKRPAPSTVNTEFVRSLGTSGLIKHISLVYAPTQPTQTSRPRPASSSRPVRPNTPLPARGMNHAGRGEIFHFLRPQQEALKSAITGDIWALGGGQYLGEPGTPATSTQPT